MWIIPESDSRSSFSNGHKKAASTPAGIQLPERVASTTPMTIQQLLFKGKCTDVFTFSLMEASCPWAALALRASLHLRHSAAGGVSRVGTRWFGRLQLVWRVVARALFTRGRLAGGMLDAPSSCFGWQSGVFARPALKLNFFNPAPWCSLCQCPRGARVSRRHHRLDALRLDPVAIIEGDSS